MTDDKGKASGVSLTPSEYPVTNQSVCQKTSRGSRTPTPYPGTSQSDRPETAGSLNPYPGACHLARPEASGGSRTPSDYQENRGYAESQAYCNPIHEISHELGRQAYSFSDSYPSSFSEEDRARYQSWENNQMDYLGVDASDNIIAKIEKTLLKNSHHPHAHHPEKHQEYSKGPK